MNYSKRLTTKSARCSTGGFPCASTGGGGSSCSKGFFLGIKGFMRPTIPSPVPPEASLAFADFVDFYDARRELLMKKLSTILEAKVLQRVEDAAE